MAAPISLGDAILASLRAQSEFYRTHDRTEPAVPDDDDLKEI